MLTQQVETLELRQADQNSGPAAAEANAEVLRLKKEVEAAHKAAKVAERKQEWLELYHSLQT